MPDPVKAPASLAPEPQIGSGKLSFFLTPCLFPPLWKIAKCLYSAQLFLILSHLMKHLWHRKVLLEYCCSLCCTHWNCQSIKSVFEGSKFVTKRNFSNIGTDSVALTETVSGFNQSFQGLVHRYRIYNLHQVMIVNDNTSQWNASQLY